MSTSPTKQPPIITRSWQRKDSTDSVKSIDSSASQEDSRKTLPKRLKNNKDNNTKTLLPSVVQLHTVPETDSSEEFPALPERHSPIMTETDSELPTPQMDITKCMDCLNELRVITKTSKYSHECSSLIQTLHDQLLNAYKVQEQANGRLDILNRLQPHIASLMAPTGTPKIGHSYADKLNSTPVPLKALVIDIKDETLTPTTLRQELNKVRTHDIKITDCRESSNGKMIIKTQKEEDLEIIQARIQQSATLQARIDTSIKGPPKQRMIMFSVSNDITDEDIIQILQQEIPQSQFQDFTIVRRITGKNNSSHIIFDSPLPLSSALLTKSRIFVGFQRCTVKQYITLIRCFRCQNFGHHAQRCPSKEMTCSICAGPHEWKDCKSSQDPRQYECINCIRYNLHNSKKVKTNHMASSSVCSLYQDALKLKRNKIITQNSRSHN